MALYDLMFRVMKKQKKIVCIMFLFIIMFTPFFNTNASLWSITQTQISNGKATEDGKISSGYWILTFSIDSLDYTYGGTGTVTFPAGMKATKFNNKPVFTKNNIEISFSPEQGYFIRDITSQKQVTVVPSAYGGQVKTALLGPVDLKPEPTISASKLTSSHYEWASSSWDTHTPFTVSINLNSTSLYSNTIDTMGAKTGDVSIPTNAGNVIIHNLGQLGSAYSPPVASDNIIFSNKYVYTGISDFLSHVSYDQGLTFTQGKQTGFLWDNGGDWIQYSQSNPDLFSFYWYGGARWNSQAGLTLANTPAPFDWYHNDYVFSGCFGWCPIDLVTEEHDSNIASQHKTVAGWSIPEAYSYNTPIKPITPALFPEDKTESNMKYMSVTEFIESKGMTNQAETFLRGTSFDAWILDTENNKIKVPVNGPAYAKSVVQVYIPLELADTWIYEPPKPSNIKIVSSGWYGANTIGTNQPQFYCDVRQEGDETGQGLIIAETTNTKLQILSPQQTVTLAKGQTQRLWFTCVNLGGKTDSIGTILIKSQTLFGGIIMDTKKDALSFTLLKTNEPSMGKVTLSIRDAVTKQPIQGISITCNYGSSGQSKTTTSSNGLATFSIGSASSVTIVFEGGYGVVGTESKRFKPQTTIHQVGGSSLINLELIPEDAVTPFPIEYLIIGIVICVLAICLTIIVIYRMRMMRMVN